MMWIIAAVVALLVAGFLYLIWKASRGRTLSAASVQRIKTQWASVRSIGDANRRVMDAEKILDTAMTELGYTGNFADKLKKAGPRFSQLQPLWNAHKLRNRIAHEVGVSIGAAEADQALRAFEKAINDLC